MAYPQDDSQIDLADPITDGGLVNENAEKTDPENTDQLGFLGSEPNPEEIESQDTLQNAQSMGLYNNADDEHPVELGIAEELVKNGNSE